MTEFLHLLDAQMQRPSMYGIFHLTAFALTIALAVFLVIKFKNAKDGVFRRICLVFWLILVLFETYKQVNFSFNYNGGDPYWDYQWYAFPFQNCSALLYVLPFVFLSKPGGAVRRSACAYTAFYSMFAGLAVMLYPATVFTETIGINIQTMVWHGTQLALGVFFIAYHRKQLNFRFFLSAIPAFLCLVAVALALDMIVPCFTDETFNMFFISPKFPCTLPLLSVVWDKAPWPVFIAAYILGFTLAALLMYLISKLVFGKASGKHNN